MKDESNIPCFKQRLEIRQDHRPAVRHGRDEDGILPLHGMSEGELHSLPHRLNVVDATGNTLCLELRLPFTEPTHYQPLRRNALDNLTRVHEAAVSIHSPRGADLPIALDAHSKAILLYNRGR